MATVETSEGGARLLTVGKAARVLRCSPASIYRRVHDGTLPALRMGGESGPLRFTPDAVYRVLRPVHHDGERWNRHERTNLAPRDREGVPSD